MANEARVHQINVSDGGVPKRAVERGEAQVGALGIDGDSQANTRIHGGPDKALCLWSLEVIEALQQEGHPIDVGNTGENLTLAGLDWAALVPGTRLRIGGGGDRGGPVRIEISDFCTPCSKNAGWFTDGNFMRVSHKRHDGVSRLYARVLEGGTLRRGDAVVVESASDG